MKKQKKKGLTYVLEIFENGDTLKQVLARSRYLLFKHYSKWTEKQKLRAQILFDKYPKIHESYKLSMELYNIYQNTKDKWIAFTKLAQWYRTVKNSGFKTFNAKIKGFRIQFRGVRDVNYFLFRLEKIFA